MDDSCAVCAESLEWVAYGPCGHRDVCSTCVVRLRFVLGDHHCCICKTENPTVFTTKAMGAYTKVITDFSVFPKDPSEGKIGDFWYHEGAQALFDDVDQYRMIKAICRLSCSLCDRIGGEQGVDPAKRRSRFRSIQQLKGHLFHQHKLFMCSLCLEGRKVFICEQKLYTRAQLNQHISTGDLEVDGSESERGGFMGHPLCEFCKTPFYGDNELYLHMSTEHYTCHFCQRQHPGQYDYYKNYDDLETHFRQEHFLCEDEACLAKKFIVFQSESDMKKHNVMEHGGNMSRSKRNAVLQIPTSFSFRRTLNEDDRRGRGRGFCYDRSDNNLSMVIQASLESVVADLRVSNHSSPERRELGRSAPPVAGLIDSSMTTSPELPSRFHSSIDGQSSRTASILEDISFPPLADRDSPQISSKYAQTLRGFGNASAPGKEAFPPLPCMKKSGKQKAKKDLEVLGRTTMAARPRNKTSHGVELHSTGPSQAPMEPTTSASLQVNQASQNGFLSSISTGSGISASKTTNMKHSSSAPSLNEGGSSSQQAIASCSSVEQFQNGRKTLQTSSQRLPQVEDFHMANKSLIERIRSGLNMDEDMFSAFKSISAEYRQDLINTWQYLSYVEQFGLSHLIVELARLCPDARKQKELLDAYYSSVRAANGVQMNGGADAASTKVGNLSKKGKGKALDQASSTREDFADSFMSRVKRLQADRNKSLEEEVEVLSKDGYLASKDKGCVSSSARAWLVESDGAEELSKTSTSPGATSDAAVGSSKTRKKTSKFHRLRLGDDSVASQSNKSLYNDDGRPAESASAGLLLPVRGVWRNGGGQRLVANSNNFS